jgi:hypothetical protein
MRALVVGSEKKVASCPWSKQRSAEDGVEVHPLYALQMPWPNAGRAGEQGMEVVKFGSEGRAQFRQQSV